jgi:hypothetical protein
MTVLGYLLAIRTKLKLAHGKTTAEYELELDAQRKYIDFQRKEISRLEKLNTDQDEQIRALLKSGASLADSEQYARTKKEYDQMKAEVDKIGMFLRENMKDEIDAGRHGGMTLAEVCIMYMRRGKSVAGVVQ